MKSYANGHSIVLTEGVIEKRATGDEVVVRQRAFDI